MFRELFRPFAYLTIRHEGGLPFFINWGFPVLISGLLAYLLSKWGFAVNMFGETGVVAKLLSFIQSLPGFFIAALAVIATLNNADMLKVMPGQAPTMLIIYHGKLERTELTRRRFLSSMFAFLTAESLLLTLGAVALLAISDIVKRLLPETILPYVSMAGAWAYLCLLAQMLSVTMWGLYYLGERVHTPD